MKNSKKQLGARNTKNYSKGSGKMNKLRNPWGSPVAKRAKGAIGRVTGSSTRKSTPDASLSNTTKGYPRNQPSQWPTEPDFTDHTLPPSPTGLNSTTAARHNSSVEHAYTRAKYQ